VLASALAAPAYAKEEAAMMVATAKFNLFNFI
jgi:hypothetical protein